MIATSFFPFQFDVAHIPSKTNTGSIYGLVLDNMRLIAEAVSGF